MEASENLLKFTIHLISRLRQVAKSLELSLSQLIFIAHLPIDGTSIAKISQNLNIDNSTLTRNINVLCKKKLLTTNKSKVDKREKIVILTRLGISTQIAIDDKFEFIIKQCINKSSISSFSEFNEQISQITWALILKSNNEY